MVPTASEKGMTKTRTRRPVITTTAARRLRTLSSIISSSGQVAITIMLAQISAGRNGLRIQKLAVSRAPMRAMTRMFLTRSFSCA